MSAQKTLSDPSLQRLRNNIIASIAFRGTRPEQTKIGGVISKLFELYEDDPKRFYRWDQLWKHVWPEDFAAHKNDPWSVSGPKIRTTVERAKTAMRNYFSGDGRDEPYRVTIEKGVYRLTFVKNDFPTPQPRVETPMQPSAMLGLLLPQSDWFSSDLIAGALNAASSANHFLWIAFGDGDLFEERQQLSSLRQRCSGIVVVPVLDEFAMGATDLSEHFWSLEQEGYPIVFANHRVPDCDGPPLVSSDDVEGGRLAAEVLHSELSFEEIFILAEPGSLPARKRIEGALGYFEKLGEPSPGVHVEFAQMPGELGGAEFAEKLNKERAGSNSKRDSIGIFATDDRLAEGIRGYQNSPEGYKLRRSLLVLGFGGQDLGFSFPPRVSIKQDYKRLGAEAVEVLLRCIGNRRKGFARSTIEFSRKIPVELSVSIPDYERALARNVYRETRPIKKRLSGSIAPPRQGGRGGGFGDPGIVP